MLESPKLRRIAFWYVAVQAAIWAKCAAFFAWFGHGRVALFNISAFTPEAIAFNFWFHEAMHLAIAVLALLFGKNLKRVEWVKLAAVVFIAVALHNAGYWLTSSHPSAFYSAVDFALDSTALFAAVLVGFGLGKILRGRAEA